MGHGRVHRAKNVEPELGQQMSSEIKRSRRWLFSLLSLTLLFSTLEGCAWWLERRAYHGKVSLSLGDAAGGSLYLNTDHDSRPQLRPGARLEGSRFEVSINQKGFRGPDLRSPRPRDGIRIWFIGGSTTFDIYAPSDAETWPALTGSLLGQALANPDVEVINAGIPGEIIRGNREDFEAHYGSVMPDVLILHAGPNDLRAGSQSSAPGGQLEPEPEPGILHRLALFRTLSRKLQWQRVPSSWTTHQIDEHHWNRLEKDLTDFAASARSKGVEVVLATHAHRAEEDATGRRAARQVAEGTKLLRMDPEGVIRTFSEYNERIRTIAKARSLPLIDLREAVPAEGRYFGDHTHFSAEGSRVAAEAAVEVLKTLDLSRR